MRAIFSIGLILIIITILAIALKSVKVASVPDVTATPIATVIQTATPISQMNNQTPSATTTATGLKIEDEKVGTGDTAVAGKKVTVNYVGTLTNGTKFDSSYDRNQPFTFNLGAAEVIKGWDEGVAGMKVGGKRKLTIPSNLAYGPAGAGSAIPGNSTLIFEVELLQVQ